MMGGMATWMLLWGLVGLALLGLAVVGIVTMVRGSDRDADRVPRVESPDEVLKRRYAAGEIGEDEFLTKRAGLSD
ncbi:MAG: SHOCT domain-containing protein [Marmoricola sp.]